MTRGRIILIVTLGLAACAGAGWLGVRAGFAFLDRLTSPEWRGRAGGAHGASPVSASGWSPAEREAIERATPKGSRPAGADDAEPSQERDDLVALYGAYTPYFVRGDLNGDGRLDFVQAYVRQRDGQPVFDVAVFLGGEGGYAPPIFVERGIELAAGDLAIDRTILIVTPDLATDESYRLRFDPETRKFIDVDATNSDPTDDSPEPAPDRRPRTRV